VTGRAGEHNAKAEALDDLIDALRRFTAETDLFVDVFARTHGLGRSHLNAIMWISASVDAGQPLTAGELAGKLGLGPPATTALIDKLESAGHVVRDRDPHDRRKVTLRVQDAARQVARRFFAPLGVGMGQAAAGFSIADLQTATEVVRRMTRVVTEVRRDPARAEVAGG
jgi:DNA-binding MarR family transcriptional regulator